MGRIYRINVKPKSRGRGLPKAPVREARIHFSGVEGDFNRYRHEKKGGNPDWAVLVYPVETIRQLQREGWPVQPGHLGENLTTRGVDYESFAPGRRYAAGQAIIEITEPCTPCTNLGLLPYVDDRVKEFMQTLRGRRGWYARVVQEGAVRQDDLFEIAEQRVLPTRAG